MCRPHRIEAVGAAEHAYDPANAVLVAAWKSSQTARWPLPPFWRWEANQLQVPGSAVPTTVPAPVRQERALAIVEEDQADCPRDLRPLRRRPI